MPLAAAHGANTFKKGRNVMRNRLLMMSGVLASVGLAALAGCASSMVPAGIRRADAGITAVIRASLQASEKVTAKQVDVETREDVVYLTGVVDTAEVRDEAGRIAWRTKNVIRVVNDLTVGKRTTSSRMEDGMIKFNVQSGLLTRSGVKSGDIDVGSSQGVVTLIGRVSSESIKRIAECIAFDTNGVKDVHNELLVGMKE
jgi:hyperosmotically inducible periplasmic protein